METIKKLYEKLWRSLIRPQRMTYCDYDLGGSFLSFGEFYALRFDFELTNIVNETFNISIYLPCDPEEKIKENMDFVVYCHTHNGNRMEGLGLAEKAICNELGYVVFDFRANGFSTGKYVTLGWLEALDINEVINFLKTEVKAKLICLWGRSMGGCAIMFFLSQTFRKKINEMCAKMNKPEIKWANKSYIQCVIIDSSFPNLINSISFMVKNKAKQVPEMLVGLVLKATNGDIKEKAGIDLTQINPIDFIQDICHPIYMIIGNEDELVKYEHFSEMFQKCPSKIKKLKLFKGAHADDRPEALFTEIFDFILEMFKLKKHYSDVIKSKSNSGHLNMFLNQLSNQEQTEISGRFITVDDTFDINEYGNDYEVKLSKKNSEKEGKSKKTYSIFDKSKKNDNSILKLQNTVGQGQVVQVQRLTSMVDISGRKLISQRKTSDLIHRDISSLHVSNQFAEKLKPNKIKENQYDFASKLSNIRVNPDGMEPKWALRKTPIESQNETIFAFRNDKLNQLIMESNMDKQNFDKLMGNNKPEFNDLSIRINSKINLASRTVFNDKSRIKAKPSCIIEEKKDLNDDSFVPNQLPVHSSARIQFSQKTEVPKITSETKPFVPEMRIDNNQKANFCKYKPIDTIDSSTNHNFYAKQTDFKKFEIREPKNTNIVIGLQSQEFTSRNKDFDIYHDDNPNRGSDFFDVYDSSDGYLKQQLNTKVGTNLPLNQNIKIDHHQKIELTINKPNKSEENFQNSNAINKTDNRTNNKLISNHFMLAKPYSNDQLLIEENQKLISERKIGKLGELKKF